jgi:hypothetical protein
MKPRKPRSPFPGTPEYEALKREKVHAMNRAAAEFAAVVRLDPGSRRRWDQRIKRGSGSEGISETGDRRGEGWGVFALSRPLRRGDRRGLEHGS